MPNHTREMGEKREYGYHTRPISNSNEGKFLQRWAQGVRQEARTAVARTVTRLAPKFTKAEIEAHRKRYGR